MNDKLYRIKPLEWTDDTVLIAGTPFGYYYIYDNAILNYYFDDGDNGSIVYNTIEECKQKAEEDWLNRIKEVLEEVK